jgi:alkanesulfonate monooxygenase SsuD/methylene tetrahydromethanopterin reductase-like flavin-dependent oxidoreductase (luciferase family)
MAFTQICCVADSDAEAERLYEDAVRYFYTHNPQAMRFLTPPGYTSAASVRSQVARGSAGLSAQDRRRAASGELSFWEYDELGYIVAGTPERVRQRLRELATELRVGQLIACLHMGDLPEEVAARNTELFGREVIPHLRDLWADEPDHWTPAVSQQRVAAAAARSGEPAVALGGA